MRPPARLRPAAADDDAILDHHRADRRIGPGPAQPASAQRQRKLHKTAIKGGIGDSFSRIGLVGGRSVATLRAGTGLSASSSPLNSASACSKSRGSRKFLFTEANRT